MTFKSWRSLLAGLLASLLVLSPALAGYPNGSSNGANLAGYGQTGSGFTSVAAKWKVPFASVNPNTTLASTMLIWVGIDGLASDTSGHVAQCGTDADLAATTGVTTYFSWWASATGAVTELSSTTNPTVPGDIMSVSITCSGTCTTGVSSTYNCSIQNITENWTFTHSITTTLHLTSAEIIVEAPVNGQTVPYPNYGTAIFQNVLIKGAAPNLTTSQELYSTIGSVVKGTSNPSDPNGTSDGFNVCFGPTNNVYTTCPTPTTFANANGQSGSGF